MMHAKISATGLPDPVRDKMLENINDLHELEIYILNTSNLVWMASQSGDLSEAQRGAFRSIEVTLERFSIEVRRIADELGTLVKGGEKIAGLG
jgi:hypothetical protein